MPRDGAQRDLGSPDGNDTASDVLIPAVVFLLLVGFAPFLAAPSFAPKAAALLVLAALGLPTLIAGRPVDRLPRRLLLGFVIWALLGAVLAHDPAPAFFGLYNWGTGWIFVLCLACAWAAARSLSSSGTARLELAVIAAFAMSCAVALIQQFGDLRSFELGTGTAARTTGLMGNAVHLGALSASTLALALPRWREGPMRWAPLLVGIGLTAQLSGSRIALIILIALVAWHGRWLGLRRGIAAIALLALGVGLAAGITRTRADQATSRLSLATQAQSSKGRLETWKEAVSAIEQNPLLGAGGGRFRTATSQWRTPAVAAADGPDHLFADAHNLVVQYSVTTGVVGALLLLGFLASAVRGARGHRLAAATVLLVTALVEPQSLAITPLAFVLLGSAATSPIERRPRAAWSIVPAAIALALGGVLLTGDAQLRSGGLDFALGNARQSASLLRGWPQPVSLEAKIYLFRYLGSQDSRDLRSALALRAAAVTRDPHDPALWNDLGELELYAQQPTHARSSFNRALHDNPVSARGELGVGRAELALNNPGVAATHLYRALHLASAPEVATLLRTACRRAMESRQAAAVCPKA